MALERIAVRPDAYVEDEFLTATDMKLIGQYLERMKVELGEIKQVRT